MNKRILAIFMVFVMGIGLLTGCQQKAAAAAPAAVDTVIETAETNDFGWEMPVKTIDITYYKKGQSNPDKVEKNTAIMKKYLLDTFNVNINKVVYDTDANERFNLMLTSGDYPAVMTGLKKADVIRMQQLGKLIDMTPYVDKIGTNIKSELGDQYGRYLDADGKIIGLPYGWGMLPIPDYSAHLRLDWYKELGSPKIETPEDYYAVLKDMLKAHPTGADGKKAYALSWSDAGSDMVYGINTVAGVWGLKDGYKEDADHNLVHWINTDEGKEFTQFYNQVYRDGMFDPDAFSNKYEDWKTKFSGERILGHIGSWWQSWDSGHEIWQKTNPNWQEEQRFVQIKIKDAEAEAAYLSAKDTTGWGYTVLTDKCTNPAEVIKFLDFSMTPNGTRLMAWGVPNTPDSNWMIEKGNWSFNETAKAAIIDSSYDYDAHDLLGPNQYWLTHGQGSMSDNPKVNAWIDQCFNDEAKWKKLMADNLADTIYDNSAMAQIDFLPDNPVTIQKQQIEDIIVSSWSKTVLSKTEEEFEKNYAQMKEALNKAGIRDLEAYMTQEYNKNLTNWANK